MIFIFAQPPLLPSIKALSAECGLYHADLDAEKVKHLLMCRAEGQLAGIVGMEVLGEAALLRPPAVAPAFRGRGIGSLLLVRIERFAALQGARQFYLAAGGESGAFFAERGYRALAATEVPPEVHANEFFRHHLTQGAACLVKPLQARKVPAARHEAGPVV
ncbi:GNAT family N-acetyltransferase [Geoalkalibacter halelectricus]|uniref:GNAT family N-acetyltransferase n=1 Tax=Geoalkalibacter halelectricus TaxID=2847045 RepID=A0ABY5ZU86_9BACT|nr:GNAT family N-acetyltransferase [Geoalkalibacter halelectricus]MDO3377634.1 GNAT family N-acetyltransferase [Geoalkalibacter halelectricus]UWZ81425.1 GNAT family N-acetyltransferase [Geoalkalibacter halelectricus]